MDFWKIGESLLRIAATIYVLYRLRVIEKRLR